MVGMEKKELTEERVRQIVREELGARSFSPPRTLTRQEARGLNRPIVRQEHQNTA